jgi:mono/diheme cytochrome c family protein
MPNMQMTKTIVGLAAVCGVMMLAGCKAGGDYQGLEYAPNMYHSVAYEPLTQITDKNAGWIVNALDNPDHGEFYNSNQYNPFAMTMRVPPAHTVKRTANGWLPYRSSNDTVSLRMADKLINPYDTSAAILADGKFLFETYCKHCHGPKGGGDGKVSEKFAGVANLKSDALKKITEGHIFHVITYGK